MATAFFIDHRGEGGGGEGGQHRLADIGVFCATPPSIELKTGHYAAGRRRVRHTIEVFGWSCQPPSPPSLMQHPDLPEQQRELVAPGLR